MDSPALGSHAAALSKDLTRGFLCLPHSKFNVYDVACKLHENFVKPAQKMHGELFPTLSQLRAGQFSGIFLPLVTSLQLLVLLPCENFLQSSFLSATFELLPCAVALTLYATHTHGGKPHGALRERSRGPLATWWWGGDERVCCPDTSLEMSQDR